MSFSIQHKTAIVTGAAKGIGLAIARHFLDCGANVVLCDSDEAGLEAEIGPEARKEGQARMFAGDLRERLTVANLLSTTIDAFDRIDILVNAARECTASDPLAPEDGAVQRMLDQNLFTSLRLSQAVAKRMISQSEEGENGRGVNGAIVNLSSIAARRTRPQMMAYSIATAAVDQMTRSLAVALASHRIRVNAVAFGSVMSASLKEKLRDNAEGRQEIRACTPMGRIAGAVDLVETVQFLASDASAFMTGQIVTVDGGRTLIDPVTNPTH